MADNTESEYCFCGDLIAEHNRCYACGMLIGPKHLEKTPRNYNGKTYCGYCYAMQMVSQFIGNRSKN